MNSHGFVGAKGGFADVRDTSCRFGCHYPVLLGIIASHYKDFLGSVGPFLSYF